MVIVVMTMPVLARTNDPYGRTWCGTDFCICNIIGLIVGFIGGAIRAFICNVAAGAVGPIEADLEA